ncbi:acyltransferase domain-containing protein (plasmid) [Mycobacterium ulcerans]|nr:acyltransferase domain-containing protein [Mycobacterium ulcerans]
MAGALTLPEAAAVVALRSRVLTDLAGAGAMASVLSPEEPLTQLLARWDGKITVAAVNGPAGAVVSGDTTAITELLTTCEHENIDARAIPVDYPLIPLYGTHPPSVPRRATRADTAAINHRDVFHRRRRTSRHRLRHHHNDRGLLVPQHP